MNDSICIKTYLNRHEADLDRAFLESCGFRVRIKADDLGGMMPGLDFGAAGVRLLVAKGRAGEALELLESIPGSE